MLCFFFVHCLLWLARSWVAHVVLKAVYFWVRIWLIGAFGPVLQRYTEDYCKLCFLL